MSGKASIENGKKGGRPKGTVGTARLEADKAKEYIAKRVTENLEPIINKALEQAIAGDKDARRDLLDRGYGKPKETVEHTGNVSVVFDL